MSNKVAMPMEAVELYTYHSLNSFLVVDLGEIGEVCIWFIAIEFELRILTTDRVILAEGPPFLSIVPRTTEPSVSMQVPRLSAVLP